MIARLRASLEAPSPMSLAWRDERRRAVAPPAVGESLIY
jgi:hypothetical protein